MTPIRNPTSSCEKAYNVAHREAHNCIKQCIGVLKNSFRILGEDNCLRYTPVKCGTIINACAILHNIMIDANIPTELEPKQKKQIKDENEVEIELNANPAHAGNARRQRLVKEFFS